MSETPAGDRSRRRRLAFRWVGVGAAALAGFAGLEAFCWAFPARVPAFLLARLSDQDRAALAIHASYADKRLDPQLGFQYRGHGDHPGASPGDLLYQGLVNPTTPPTQQQADAAFTIPLDEQGFRVDTSTHESPDLVAVGDSFTMGPTERQPWPALLSKAGLEVRNLGVNGYGPQQAVRALGRFGLEQGPRVVVLAFCEANDIHDASTYEAFAQSGLTWPEYEAERLGYHYRPGMFLAALGRSSAPAGSSGPDPAASPVAPPLSRAATPIQVTLGGAEMAFGFFVWHWRDLARSRQEWEAQPGWGPTRDAILEAQRLCAQAEAELVVLFLPSKLHVLFGPILQSIRPEAIRDQFEAFDDVRTREEIRALLHDLGANQDVLRDLLEGLCRERSIRFVDATSALRAEAVQGRQTYYSYDSHPNPHGHEVIAEVVERYLRVERLWPD